MSKGGFDAPQKVQAFLDTEVTYNNDHATPDREETAWTPASRGRCSRTR